MNCNAYIELSENVEAKVEVLFTCTCPGMHGDYWAEAGGPVFETESVDIIWIAGENWHKDGEELGDWYDIVVRLTEKALDDELLYDYQLYEYWEK